jgi:acetate kinase
LRVLVVNAGSTSLKLAVVDDDGMVEAVGTLEDAPRDVDAVAHRIVHGGSRFREPTLVDDDVERQLHELTELAPLHNAPALEALGEARARLPGVPQIAVFDTAFHATIPTEASTYALPERFRELGVRRYGFHGLSVQWASEQVHVHRLVVCHLGGGCSVTAVEDGRSIDTTMGLTPLEGVPMATRSGSVDPGAMLHLLRHGVGIEELDRALEHESGLLGLGGAPDVRELERSASPAAKLALDVFVYRVASAVGAMAAALGGLDALVFTAGIGENSAVVRRRVCERLGFLGVEIDPGANDAARPDTEIGKKGSPLRVVVLTAREDLVMARAAREMVRGSA